MEQTEDYKLFFERSQGGEIPHLNYITTQNVTEDKASLHQRETRSLEVNKASQALAAVRSLQFLNLKHQREMSSTIFLRTSLVWRVFDLKTKAFLESQIFHKMARAMVGQRFGSRAAGEGTSAISCTE